MEFKENGKKNIEFYFFETRKILNLKSIKKGEKNIEFYFFEARKILNLKSIKKRE